MLCVAFFLIFSTPAASQLPSVIVKDIKGKAVDTSTLGNDGKPFIIDFWATWCKPCVRELKAIDEVYEEWEAQTGVKIYAVSIDEAQNSAKVKPFVDGMGWHYEVLLDPNGDFKNAMNIKTVPATIVCNGKGKVMEMHTGYVEGGEEELYEVVKKYSQPLDSIKSDTLTLNREQDEEKSLR